MSATSDSRRDKTLPVGRRPCGLCHERKPLVQSHVIPKFVIRYLKATGSGFFRRPVKPNLKHQDIPTTQLLCQECEQRFSRREAYFRDTIFDPYMKRKCAHFDYDGNLHYFLVSILWRVLVSDMAKYVKEYPHVAGVLSKAEEDWRRYLLGEERQTAPHIHLFLTDVLENLVVPVRGYNMYMARALDGTVAAGARSCLVYAKFVRFCVFAWLSGYDPSLWVNTRVVDGNGELKTPQEIRDVRISDFLLSRIRDGMTQYRRNLSGRQRDRISAHQQQLLPRLADSDMGDALLADSLSTIDTGFFPRRRLERNEPCPCGSGKKFKNCCGKPGGQRGWDQV